MPFELPKLAFSYDALEPYIDAQTMEIHHSKHHAAYIANLNKAIEAHPEYLEKEIEELLTDLTKLPTDVKVPVQNNGGGHYNHSFFWQLLTPTTGTAPEDGFAEALNQTYGSLENFKMEFGKTAMARFGSGWAWLFVDRNNKLTIASTPNQDTPLSQGYKPVLALDVWEHAYYLKYQNKRADYINAFWNVVNWQQVSANFNAALTS